MKIKAAIIMTGISIGLLVLYGADVAVGGGGTGEGFLGSDHMARGIGLGMPSIILPIVGFFISFRKPSKILGAMIIVSGILIIAGGSVVLAAQDPSQAIETGRSSMAEAGPLLGIGAVIIGLGALKLSKY